MSVVDEAVQDGVGVGGVADDVVPGGHRELGGDDRRSAAISLLEDFEQVMTGAGVERLKAEVVSADEREDGLRRVLNLGHTIGHALEAETGYRRLLHGEAVAWGMIAATNIALSVGRTDSVTAGRIADAVLSLGRLPEVNVSSRKILARLQSDKKTQNGVVHFILPREIGKVEVASDVPSTAVIDAVEELRRLSRGGWVWEKQ